MLSTEAQSCLFIFYGGVGVTDLASRSSDLRGLLSCTVPPCGVPKGTCRLQYLTPFSTNFG